MSPIFTWPSPTEMRVGVDGAGRIGVKLTVDPVLVKPLLFTVTTFEVYDE